MADTIGLSDVSSKDTGKGKVLKTGNLKRSYNMATCPKGQVYDQKLKKCRVQKESAHEKIRTSIKSKRHEEGRRIHKINPKTGKKILKPLQLNRRG